MEGIAWKEWSQATFEKARSENKPVLLSISASWCHWCHVMDNTTFSDADVARIANEKFVPVRVDTDKRPDINSRYNMGGWPTVVTLTPAGTPIDGSTYMPAPAFASFLMKSRYVFDSFGEKIDERHRSFTAPRALEKESRTRNPAGEKERQEFLGEMFGELRMTFDQVYGGFGFEPKFPQHGALAFLLCLSEEEGIIEARRMLEKSLLAMKPSGIWDSAEGGFFRYSTTRDWAVPHYEKMLEDNALLASAYFNAHRIFGNKGFLETGKRTAEFMLRDMFDSEKGAFWGSIDADEHYYSLPLPERKGSARPFIDKTVYADWNALCASAFFNAYASTGEERYRETAFAALEYVWSRLVDGKTLRHSDAPGSAEAPLKDYALLLRATLEAYEFSFDPKHAERAEALLEAIEGKFGSARGAYYDIAADEDAIGALAERRENVEDNALMAECLLKAAFVLEREELKGRALAVVGALLEDARHASVFGMGFATSCLLLERGMTEIRIIGDKEEESTSELAENARGKFGIGTVIGYEEHLGEGGIASVCRNRTCLAPAKSPMELERRLNLK